MKNFITRAITGILFVVVLVGAILYSPLSFSLLFTLIAALSVAEFAHLANNHAGVTINRTISALAGAYLVLAFTSYCTSTTDSVVFLPYLLLLLYLMIAELYLKRENPLGNWAFTALSQLYVALPFALLNVLAFHQDVDGQISYNPILPLSVFVFIWLSDTGAYLVGSLVGRNRLFERISPKKSWEGFFGGLLGAIAMGYVAAQVVDGNCAMWIGMALIAALTGVFGDLVESLFKRSVDVKDSGNILPGHGGWLDRFDALILSIPFVFVYLVLWMN